MPKQASVFKGLLNKSDVTLDQLKGISWRMDRKLKEGKITKEEYKTLYTMLIAKRKQLLNDTLDKMNVEDLIRMDNKEITEEELNKSRKLIERVRTLFISFVDENAEKVLKGI